MYQLFERYVANDQQVDIAVALKFVSRGRTEDEGRAHAFRERLEALTKYAHSTGRLQ
jgi:hypothetical protein